MDLTFRPFHSREQTSLSSLEVMAKDELSGWLNYRVNLGGKVGRIQCHVIFGSTPMLLGRPFLEMMNAVVDFGNWRMRLMDGNWQSVRKGRHGAMLLRLAEGVKNLSSWRTQFLI